MKKIVVVSVFAAALCQSVWADGFEVEGASDEASYEGSVAEAQSIQEGQSIQAAAQGDAGVLSAELALAVNSNNDSVGVSDRFSSPVPFVFFNTKLEGMVGKKVSHRWFYHGELVLEEFFIVDKMSFSAVSKKNMNPKNMGEWRVEVRQQDTLLKEKSFTYLAGV